LIQKDTSVVNFRVDPFASFYIKLLTDRQTDGQTDKQTNAWHYIISLAVAALHQGAPAQMTWLEDPPPWLHPAYCFALLR